MLPFKRFIIKGHSMQPLFKEGDHIVINKFSYIFSKPKKGDIVVFKTINDSKFILKRVVKEVSQGFVVKGENRADSLDTGYFGLIKKDQIIGRLFIKY